MGMTIYIPTDLLIALGIGVAWFALGWLFNRFILLSIQRRQWKRTGKNPEWPLIVAYIACGPIGWGFWCYDKWDDRRSHKKWEEFRQRKNERKEQGYYD